MPKSKQRKNRKKYTPPKSEQERLELEEQERLEELGKSDLAEGTLGHTLEQTFLENEFDAEEFQGRSEKFINDNKGMVLGVLGICLLLAAAYFFFTRVYAPGQETEAQADLFQAQQYFDRDSFRLALQGDGNFPGFLEIIDNHGGGTKAVNLANYYAGISYLNLGEYQNAINYLGNFQSDDIMVSGMALGAMGDAYMELGDESQGISYYKKAAARNPNELVSPIYYLKAGMALEKSGDFAGAKDMYSRLNEYPNSPYSQDVKKYLARVESKI